MPRLAGLPWPRPLVVPAIQSGFVVFAADINHCAVWRASMAQAWPSATRCAGCLASSGASSRSSCAAAGGGRSAAQGGQQRRRRLRHRAQQRAHRRGFERRPAGQQLVGQHAERVEVAARVGRLAGEQLGRHVDRRADKDAAARGQRIRGSGQAEVGQHRAPRRQIEQHVARFDVAVHDTLAVRVGQRFGELRGDVEHQRLGQAMRGAGVARQRAAGQQLHDDERQTRLASRRRRRARCRRG